MGIKALFIYPNTYGMNMLPPAIAGFSALLKQHGHEVSLFDKTYYAIDYGIDADGVNGSSECCSIRYGLKGYKA